MKRSKKAQKKSQKMMFSEVDLICARRNVRLILREIEDSGEVSEGLQKQLDKYQSIIAKYTE